MNAMLETLVQFGVAGLMGLLWVWERMHSRHRERQLSEAHDRLIGQQQQIGTLVQIVRQNTRALVAAERMQRTMCDLLVEIGDEIRKRKAA